jgi:hypothetical protein
MDTWSPDAGDSVARFRDADDVSDDDDDMMELFSEDLLHRTMLSN